MGWIAERITDIWREALELPSVSATDNFFDLGGDSLLAVSVVARVRADCGTAIDTRSLFDAPQLSRFIELVAAADAAGMAGADDSLLVKFADGAAPPLFFVHSLSGEVEYLRPLSRYALDRPLWGVRSVGLDGRDRPLESVEAMALRYMTAIKTVRPAGPYFFAGYCIGGLIAYALAEMVASADGPAFVAIVDAVPVVRPPEDEELLAAEFVIKGISRTVSVTEMLRASGFDKSRSWEALCLSLFQTLRAQNALGGEVTFQDFLWSYDVRRQNALAQLRYRPTSSPARLVLFQSASFSPPMKPIWSHFAPVGEVHSLPVPHRQIMACSDLHDALASELQAASERV